MATLTLELPPQKAQTAFNLRRWAELLATRNWPGSKAALKPIVTVTVLRTNGRAAHTDFADLSSVPERD